MSDPSELDLGKAHQRFSTDCFNRAWDLIDKGHRSSDEDEQMLQLAMASAWHWSQREDCTARNLSVACWQISRIHALLGRADEARRYGMLSLDRAREEKDDPFYRGYAHEALARSEAVAGNNEAKFRHLRESRRAADAIEDEETKEMLLSDLATID